MNFSHLANKLRSKIARYSGIISQDLDRTARRFVREAVYGIMASQSVMLTEIGRQLECNISLKKIEARFSRQLIRPRIWVCLHQRILSMVISRVKDRTLLILDLSDLKKKCAEKMEHMATVRDGSDGGELVDGYLTNQVIIAEVGSNEIIPLHFSLYFQASPDFQGENNQILRVIDQVGSALQNRGIWVIDNGGDRDTLYKPMLQNQCDFIIRMVGKRELIHQGQLFRFLWLAVGCCLNYQKSFVRIIHGKEVQYNIRFGSFPVQLLDIDAPLNMVVVKGISNKPMMLLTSLEIRSGEKDLWFIIQAYMKRWSIEETICFIKQTYDL